MNILGFVLQTLAVSRIFKLIGVRGALFILPILALGSYGMIMAVPIFAVVRIAKILENSTDYSIQQTTRHALFLPTSREAKYNAKQAIESFFWRAGDMLQAGVVFVGASLAFTVSHFAADQRRARPRLARHRRRDRPRAPQAVPVEREEKAA